MLGILMTYIVNNSFKYKIQDTLVCDIAWLGSRPVDLNVPSVVKIIKLNARMGKDYHRWCLEARLHGKQNQNL